MKRLFLIFLLCLNMTILSQAKIIYIPSYYTGVSIEDNGLLSRDSTCTRDITITPQDERFTIYVMHDTLTAERVKEIKRYRARMILSDVATIASSVSAVTSIIYTPLTPLDALWQSVNYTNSLSLMGSSAYISALSKMNADKLSKTSISIIIQNNTDQELCINDMARGLNWYVRAYGELTFLVGNPEVNRFRIAYANSPEPHVCYAVVEACNAGEAYDVAFEDKNYWYCDWREAYSGSRIVVSFMRMSKTTKQQEIIEMNEEEGKTFKRFLTRYARKY